MTPKVPVPADPAAAWTELRDEILSWHSASQEIAGDLEDEGKDPASARAKAAAYDAVLGFMDHLAGCLNPRDDSPEESTMSQTRDDRWDQGDLHEGYGSLPGDLIERGHRVVCAEDRENNWPSRDVAERISRDARKAQLIAARRAR